MPTGNKPLYWDGLTGKEIFLHVDYFAFRTIKHTLIRGVRPKKKPECQKKKNTLKQKNTTCALGNSRKIKTLWVHYVNGGLLKLWEFCNIRRTMRNQNPRTIKTVRLAKLQKQKLAIWKIMKLYIGFTKSKDHKKIEAYQKYRRRYHYKSPYWQEERTWRETTDKPS